MSDYERMRASGALPPPKSREPRGRRETRWAAWEDFDDVVIVKEVEVIVTDKQIRLADGHQNHGGLPYSFSHKMQWNDGDFCPLALTREDALIRLRTNLDAEKSNKERRVGVCAALLTQIEKLLARPIVDPGDVPHLNRVTGVTVEGKVLKSRREK